MIGAGSAMAGRLQEHPTKWRDFAPVAPHQQSPERRFQIAAERAAEAAARHHGNLAVNRLN